jgi:hypothetical protein
VHRLLKQQRQHGGTHVAARAPTAAAPVPTAETRTERPEPAGATKAAAETARTEAAAGTEPTGPAREAAAAAEVTQTALVHTLASSFTSTAMSAVVPLVAALMPMLVVANMIANMVTDTAMMTAPAHLFVAMPVSPPLARHPAHRLNEGRLGPLVAESPGARTYSTIC